MNDKCYNTSFIRQCPGCGDLVYIVKDANTGELFCMCGDCLLEWDDPADIEDGGYAGYRSDVACEVNGEDIIAKGWVKYLNFPHIVTWCPVCNSGWVTVKKEERLNKLFCYCDECASSWDNPSDITAESAQSGLPWISEASDEEIEEKGWTRYLM